MNPDEYPWGEQSFERDRNWFGHLSRDGWQGDEKELYSKLREKALNEPTFDLFAEFMPTGRPKHDIGRYVLRHSVNVPLINSMAEWQSAVMTGSGMIRSEHWQDYSGQSGLYSSEVLRLRQTYPLDEQGYPDEHYEVSEDRREYVLRRTYHGPPKAELDIGNIAMLHDRFDIQNRLGSSAVTGAFADMLKQGLFDGSVNPAMYMRLRHWNWEDENHMINALSHRSRHSISADSLRASRWRYVPGVNIRIFRDNVMDGKYFIGGKEAHHHWEVKDGTESADVEAHDKAGYRGRATSYDTLQYTLPTGRIVELYEKVRVLPFFDQSQAPMMEFQYDEDGKLHFLQYLKTGLQLGDPGEFELPTGDNIVTSLDVRGVTSTKGEKMRIYLDPKVFTVRMRNQGFYDDHNMSLGLTSSMEQAAAMSCRAMIMGTMLSFKDNHWSSAPLYRAPVTVGVWNGTGEVEKRFKQVMRGQPFKTVWDDYTHVQYINAIVTSNGRAASIESDWAMKSERIN